MEQVMNGIGALFGLYVIYMAIKSDMEHRRLEKRRVEVKELLEFLRKDEAI